MDTIARIGTDAPPYLEHYPEAGGGAHRLLLDHLPFQIGRNPTAHYCINSRQVSKDHAEIVAVNDEIHIRDLGSTNGTFVNGERVVEARLHHGDIVHVAHKEFRFCHETTAPEDAISLTATELAGGPLPSSIIQGGDYLRDLIRGRNVQVLFQAIVNLETLKVEGYESLGRGSHPNLSANPAQLLGMAEQYDLAPELSQVFRLAMIKEAVHLPPGVPVFVNLHPSEIGNDSLPLLASLHAAREALGAAHPLVAEFHEDAVADADSLRIFRDHLHALGIRLAYDDFGAGQARLAQLAEAPPDYIKLDRVLIQDVHQMPARQELIRALTRVASDLGIGLIAEGVETQEEAQVCAQLGCQLGQGYFFGRPQPVHAFAAGHRPDTRRVDLSSVRGRIKQSQPPPGTSS
jgi:EAL domain-containing protein (putative c-di-GMP-specific phosphodiesterase class I)